MDGISFAFAAVSLTIQLIGTIGKTKKFIKEIQNAPEELENLLDTLNQFESLLVATSNLIEQQNGIEGLPGAVNIIASVLRRCQITVGKLDNAVLSIKIYFESRSRGRKALAPFKSVMKKEHIERSCRQIQEHMVNLQTALVLNSSHLQLYQLKPPSMQHLSSSAASSLCSRSEGRDSATSSTYLVLQTKETDTWLYRGWFGKLRLHKKTKSVRTCGDNPEEAIIEEKRLLYTPSFLRTALELQYNGGFPLTLRSLSFFQVLPEEFMENICSSWSMEDFTQALSCGRFSPFARSQHGDTFLHIAGSRENPKLCALLINIGVDPSITNNSGAKAINQICKKFFDSPTDTLRLLATAQGDIDAEELYLLLDDWFCAPPECVDILLSAYNYSDKTFHASIRDFSLLTIAAREYGSGNVEWAKSIRKWLCYKPDIHARSFESESPAQCTVLFDRDSRSEFLLQHQEMTFTLLDEIFALGDDPFQAESFAQEWLLMLAEAGYDIKTYLEDEKQLHLAQNFLSYPDCSNFHMDLCRQLIFETGDTPKVSWRWWFDPLSHASLVLQEFLYMSPCHHDRYVESYGGPDHWELTWPFYYPLWSENCMPGCEEYSALQTWERRAYLAARRLNRQAKKKYPGDFEDISDGVEIPGPWVDDEF